MGKKSRTKGTQGENEARKALCKAFGIPYVKKITAKVLKRGSQTQGTDVEEDITNTPWGIEVKRYAKDLTPSQLDHAWKQACASGKDPIVLTRKDHSSQWYVWFDCSGYRAMMTLEDWATWQLSDNTTRRYVRDWVTSTTAEIYRRRDEESK